MPRAPFHNFSWGGLNTKAQATGLPLLECVHLQDMRVVGNDLVERLGIVRIGQFAGSAKAADLDGTNQHFSNEIDLRAWGLGLYWTVELAVEPGTTAGTQGILCPGSTTPAMVLDIFGGNLRLRIWDSGSNLTTVTVGAADTAVQTVQITRSGAVLTTRLNNGTAVTGAMSATLDVLTPVGDLRLGRDDGANYFNGTLDYVRVLSMVKSDHADRLVRHPNPRAEYVLADYDFKQTNALVYDRSRNENHLTVQNAPSEIASLCHDPAPIRALSMGVDEDNRKQLLIASGGLYYLATVD